MFILHVAAVAERQKAQASHAGESSLGPFPQAAAWAQLVSIFHQGKQVGGDDVTHVSSHVYPG